MYLCLRVDIDYVPWDTPDAELFGHGEPAIILRMLDLARERGLRFHFFASTRVLQAFPSTADAILNEGHDLDWLCKHPESAAERYEKFSPLMRGIGHQAMGLAVKEGWPEGGSIQGLEHLRFLSSFDDVCPAEWAHFRVDLKSTRGAQTAGLSVRAWTDQVKKTLRDYASRNRSTTIVVRPQSLTKWDPQIHHIREILDLAVAIDMQVQTLRQVINASSAMR